MTAIAFAACGGGVGDEGGIGGTTSPAGTGKTEPILIQTRMDIPTGEILEGSSIGDTPFWPGGTVEDTHGNSEIGLVDRTITCEDGTLRMGFDPQVPMGDTQSGPWRIISGTGTYEEWQGSGEMKITYESGSNAGLETFTGTVTR